MSAALALEVKTWGKTTPILKLLREELEDLEDLNEAIAFDSEEMVRLWILNAAETRHTSAEALGATPTGYLSRAAEQTTSQATSKGAEVTVRGEIFKRWRGPVTVTPKRARLLTVAINAEAYGKRARDFKNLKLVKGKSGSLALVKTTGRGKNKKIVPMFALLKKAVLPQDEGLLPGPKRRAETAEKTARDYLARLIQRGGFKR